MSNIKRWNRRAFLRTGAGAMGGLAAGTDMLGAATRSQKGLAGAARAMRAADLPKGSAPPAVPLPHFPDRLHAFVWRNWPLVPLARMARVVGASVEDLRRMGHAMGLTGPLEPTLEQQRRSALTVIRRNWHLLPYEQLLALLEWTPDQLAFSLREDDFLYIKLGNLKPACEPLRYNPPEAAVFEREKAMAASIREHFPSGFEPRDPLFGFVGRLSQPPKPAKSRDGFDSAGPRFCYSYFALYGDPLLDPAADPYPEGYLAQLAEVGVNGVWLQGVLSKLAPFPWQPDLSKDYAQRLANLRALTVKARRHGIGVYLYFNEPRSLPIGFYNEHPELKGVVEGDHAALCTSSAEVQRYLIDAVKTVVAAAPELAGIFTITGSENLSNCWSHGGGAGCPRCGKRAPAEVIAEFNGLLLRGIQAAGGKTKVLAWDWGWADDWAEAVIERLPTEVTLMSVSEWGIPIRRGGVETAVGEYSISTIGPGSRARRRWEVARRRGLKTLAKVQVGNTWELSAVPYIPALENVAQHAMNLRAAHVDGFMLGWTLGGYPSPNLELFCEIAQAGSGEATTAEQFLKRVAQRRFGAALAPAVLGAWRVVSAAFSEFPFHGSLVYTAPMQFGPSNLLWAKPTGYRATMIGFPYDDLESWRAVYPAEVYVGQFDKVASGFERAVADLKRAFESVASTLSPAQSQAGREELGVAEAAALHFRTTANQARFYLLRNALGKAASSDEKRSIHARMKEILQSEILLARRLQSIQSNDSRIGFEASNQYYYIGVDLGEKVLNCQDLLAALALD